VSRKPGQSQISYEPSSNGTSAIGSIASKEKDIDNMKKQFEANLKAKIGTDHPQMFKNKKESAFTTKKDQDESLKMSDDELPTLHEAENEDDEDESQHGVRRR